MMMMGCLDLTVVPLKNDDIIEKQLLKCVAAQSLPRTKLLNPTTSRGGRCLLFLNDAMF